MFVRRTRTRSGPYGTVCHTFRLVRSERDGAKVRQCALLNLGRHCDIPQERWPPLCRRFEQILARMARPASDRATRAWLRSASGAGELLGTDFESFGLMQLYRASDALAKHRNGDGGCGRPHPAR